MPIMSMANSGIQFAISRLSVNERPSRINGRIAELRRRNSTLVIDSAAISHDSTIVIPPASKVASDLDACAVVIWTSSLPVSGNLSNVRSITKRPAGVRDHKNAAIDPTIIAGTTQIALRISQPETASTITVTVGRLLPNPENRSDMRGTTNVVRN